MISCGSVPTIKKQTRKMRNKQDKAPLCHCTVFRYIDLRYPLVRIDAKTPTEVNKCTIPLNNYRWIDYVCFFLYFINRRLMLLSARCRTVELWPQGWHTAPPWPSLTKPDQMVPASQSQSTGLFKTARKEGMLYYSATNAEIVVVSLECIYLQASCFHSICWQKMIISYFRLS